MDHTLSDSLWVRCPICNGKTRIKVNLDTVLVRFPLYCPKLHSAAANGRWCGDQRPLCGVSGQDISKAFRRQW